ncbi:hypothetical protein GCM10010211_09870 [Streptomyces albospinus]|uniref:Uncharacterized protein n=1 Tax=Streptomyces albospinus TaxID=285515 RepID=A0ABQ2UPN7_9ACTN|nr:hypothetical protein GCM10010211_09870 [Streptomyces albospinus]
MSGSAARAWNKILTTAGEPAPPVGTPLLESFSEMVRVAYAEPRLRQLYPWTGMRELHLSRCTESRPTWDTPRFGTLGGGRYYVEGPSGSSPRIAATGSTQAAVDEVIARLPPGCGLAFVGNAEEWAAHERAQTSRQGMTVGTGEVAAVRECRMSSWSTSSLKTSASHQTSPSRQSQVRSASRSRGADVGRT